MADPQAKRKVVSYQSPSTRSLGVSSPATNGTPTMRKAGVTRARVDLSSLVGGSSTASGPSTPAGLSSGAVSTPPPSLSRTGSSTSTLSSHSSLAPAPSPYARVQASSSSVVGGPSTPQSERLSGASSVVGGAGSSSLGSVGSPSPNEPGAPSGITIRSPRAKYRGHSVDYTNTSGGSMTPGGGSGFLSPSGTSGVMSPDRLGASGSMSAFATPTQATVVVGGAKARAQVTPLARGHSRTNTREALYSPHGTPSSGASTAGMTLVPGIRAQVQASRPLTPERAPRAHIRDTSGNSAASSSLSSQGAPSMVASSSSASATAMRPTLSSEMGFASPATLSRGNSGGTGRELGLRAASPAPAPSVAAFQAARAQTRPGSALGYAGSSLAPSATVHSNGPTTSAPTLAAPASLSPPSASMFQLDSGPLSPTASDLSSAQQLSTAAAAEAAEAKVNRKILDLEITNKSLLAINASLEVAKMKQARELRDLRRRIKEGRGLSIMPGQIGLERGPDGQLLSPGAEEDGDYFEDADDGEEDGLEEDPELEACHTRCKTLIDRMVSQARAAILYEYKPETKEGGVGRVLHPAEMEEMEMERRKRREEEEEARRREAREESVVGEESISMVSDSADTSAAGMDSSSRQESSTAQGDDSNATADAEEEVSLSAILPSVPIGGSSYTMSSSMDGDVEGTPVLGTATLPPVTSNLLSTPRPTTAHAQADQSATSTSTSDGDAEEGDAEDIEGEQAPRDASLDAHDVSID